MNRRASSIIVALVLGLTGTTKVFGLTGSGTEQDPWRITSLADFDEFAADVNCWDDYTRLETDVNLVGRVYEDALIAPNQGPAFSGVFDGNNHKIEWLTIEGDKAGNGHLGLFGITDNSEIKNLCLEDSSIRGVGIIGGLVGYSYGGEISGCCFEGDVNGVNEVGGLVGSDHLTRISDCYCTGNITGVDHVGGLVGKNASGIISNSHSSTDVRGNASVGGLVGENKGSVSGCYSRGDIIGVYDVGGLVGYNKAVGLDKEGISDCYSVGDVTGEDEVGGLVGYNGGSVSNCYSVCDVEGAEGAVAGGLAGFAWNSSDVSNSWWNLEVQTHGVTESIGDDHGTTTSVQGVSTCQLQRQSTFTGWDFISVWAIGENQTYPWLRRHGPGDINKDHITNFLDMCIVAAQWMEQ